MPPLRRFAFTAPPPGCDVAESSATAAARSPRGQYDFVDKVEARQGWIRSPSHDARTIVRAADRAKDVVYDMPPLRRFAFTAPPPGCDVAESSATAAARSPRGQYDFVDKVEARQGWIRSPSHDARTIVRAADRAKDVVYVRALQASERRTMTSIEDFNLRMTAYKTELQEVHQAYLSSEARNRALLARLKILETHTKKVDKYISGLPDNIHGNVMSTRPKTLDETIELANDLMDQKLCTYTKGQNGNKRKTDDSSRNNQQQPYKKQNVDRAYTLCTKCNYHHTG
nr:hypothetical protein [Tanacetum cinerariifolium]